MGARRREHVVNTQQPPDTPPSIDNAIYTTRENIRKGIGIVDARRKAWMQAKKDLAEAKARAYLESEGTIPERNAQVTIATTAEAEAVDVAKAAYDYAKDIQKSLSKDLDAYRSISASVRETYRTTGWGDGP